MTEGKNILVTGGLGYIGSHVVCELVAKGYHPVIVDDLSNSKSSVHKRLEKLTGRTIPFFKINIANDLDQLNAVLNEFPVDGIMHFAALKSVEDSQLDPVRYFENNILGLNNLLNCCKTQGIKSFVFSSSCTVYGNPKAIPVSESAAVQPPVSAYGFTKYANEEMLKFASKAYGIKVILLRYFNPLGAHKSGIIGEDPPGRGKNILPALIQSIRDNSHFSIYGNDYLTRDGTCIRDYIHIDDLAEAHVEALEYFTNDFEVEVFNVGTGAGYTVLEVIESFEKATGKKVKIQFSDRREGDIEQIWASTDKIQKFFGWKAKKNLQEMLSSAWKFYSQEVNHKS